MPVHLQVEEHMLLDEVGMFDVSHMGEISIKAMMQVICPILSNDTNNLTDTKAQYTALCNEEGSIIDDLVT